MIHHDILGDLQGLLSDDETVVQYRGLKYAEIPARWQDSILFSQQYSEEIFDARKHGAACPQHPGAFEFDQSLVGDIRFPAPSVEQSELDCLNLVITMPAKLDRPAPVMVWYVTELKFFR